MKSMKVIPLFKNEQTLISRARKGSRRAQEELYRRYAPRMLSVARMYIRDEQQAEEVMLSGFLKVFTHLSDFRNEGSFEGWIRKIVVRQCISWMRQKDHLVFPEEPVEPEPAGYSDTASNLEVEVIQGLIDELPEGYRMVFVMYAIEGYKHREIAELLEIEIGSSKSQLFKARKILQARIQSLNQSDYGEARI